MGVKDFIQIQYFGSIRAATKKSSEELAVPPGTSILHLLERLAGIYGDGLRGEIMTEDRLWDDLTISLNGTIAKHEAAGEIFCGRATRWPCSLFSRAEANSE